MFCIIIKYEYIQNVWSYIYFGDTAAVLDGAAAPIFGGKYEGKGGGLGGGEDGLSHHKNVR